MTESGPLVFYYRDGCHLCEELASLLHRGWPSLTDNIQWLDVDSREEWRNRYAARIPVLARGGKVLCELIPDQDRLHKIFGPPENPV